MPQICPRCGFYEHKFHDCDGNIAERKRRDEQPASAPVKSPSTGSADYHGFVRRFIYVRDQIHDAQAFANRKDFAHAEDALKKVERELKLCLIDCEILKGQNKEITRRTE